MFKSFAVIVLALGLTQGSLIPAGELLKQRQLQALAQTRADASRWVDEIMANLRVLIEKNGLNHVPLPDIGYEFSETFLGITYSGELSLKKGHLEGLETIHRTGVADVTTEPNGDTLVTVEGGVNDGTLGYTGNVKFMNLGPSITADGTLKSVRVLLQIRLGEGLRPSLDKLDIKNLGTLNVDIKGLGIILNFLAEIVVNLIGNLVKDVVGELLQGVIKGLLNDVIDSALPPQTPRFNFPAAISQQQQAIPYKYIR